jgi:drug/metabolite transporter (DMT)-like permease
MAESVTIERKGRHMSPFKWIPLTLVLIAYMVVVHFTGLDMSGVAGYIFLGLGVFVLFVEFFKSGDINTWAFLLDLVSAILALIVATVLMSYLYFKLGETPTFFHWFGCAIILGDAILSPFNAFRTALRNLGLGTSV